ncbi:MAG: DUF4139 domain-containing protein [Deltaproteobacteria bacterium]|nr:DUF4139 domain-containing protein [Deltaproteobacteria bacterium]
MEVSFGIDESFKTERLTIKRVNNDPSFLSSTKGMERSYSITITNNSPKRQIVEIRENIPVSKIEDVKVELDKKNTTKGYALDKYRGLITWKLNIPAGKKETIDFGYTIKLPEDWNIGVRP